MVLWTLVSLSMLASSVQATMIGLSTEKLTRDSRLIVMGKVQEVRSHWDETGQKIESTARVQVERFLKGDPLARVLQVVYDGGEVGEIGMKVSDVSPLERGEEVILFLKQGARPGTVYRMVGKGQGKYRLENGIARKSGFSIVGDPQEIDNNIPVSDLIEKIQKADR